MSSEELEVTRQNKFENFDEYDETLRLQMQLKQRFDAS